MSLIIIGNINLFPSYQVLYYLSLVQSVSDRLSLFTIDGVLDHLYLHLVILDEIIMLMCNYLTCLIISRQLVSFKTWFGLIHQ